MPRPKSELARQLQHFRRDVGLDEVKMSEALAVRKVLGERDPAKAVEALKRRLRDAGQDRKIMALRNAYNFDNDFVDFAGYNRQALEPSNGRGRRAAFAAHYQVSTKTIENDENEVLAQLENMLASKRYASESVIACLAYMNDRVIDQLSIVWFDVSTDQTDQLDEVLWYSSTVGSADFAVFQIPLAWEALRVNVTLSCIGPVPARVFSSRSQDLSGLCFQYEREDVTGSNRSTDDSTGRVYFEKTWEYIYRGFYTLDWSWTG